MQEPRWDVIVIGAGAAGLMAALRAAERGQRTLLLEKNKRPGIKILMSGGTRCNITQATDNRGIVAAYDAFPSPLTPSSGGAAAPRRPPPGKFLHSALAAFGVRDTIAFFEDEGVATKIEDTGKIFPVSNKAADVLNALLQRLERSGATLAQEEPVARLERTTEGHFRVTTSRRTLVGDKVILTTGGQSYPGSGTTGDGYRIAASFGHTIVSPVPALVPLTTGVAWVAELRGVTLPDVAVKVLDAAIPKPLAARRGALLFAHFGLTGPAILDVSRVVSRHAHPAALQASIDLLPDTPEEQVDETLRQEAAASGKKHLAVVLASVLPRRLSETLLELAGMPRDRKAAALSREERQRLVHAVKRLAIPLTGTLGFRKAEVTAGGVALDEVDSRTMESKRMPGLYLAGEVLDLDGPIGGYNFQAAWSTGYLAGSSV